VLMLDMFGGRARSSTRFQGSEPCSVCCAYEYSLSTQEDIVVICGLSPISICRKSPIRALMSIW
jgi:hypothetical protein